MDPSRFITFALWPTNKKYMQGGGLSVEWKCCVKRQLNRNGPRTGFCEREGSPVMEMGGGGLCGHHMSIILKSHEA